MMNAQQINFQAQLQKLRQTYAATLPVKLDAIEEQRRTLDDGWDLEVLAILHRQVHSLAGSGGTFGYVQLGLQAREIEIELKAWLHDSQRPDKLHWTVLTEKLKALRKAATPQENVDKDRETSEVASIAPQ